MDPSQPLVIERAPVPRRESSRAASSQSTVTPQSHIERSRDGESRRDRSYVEEIEYQVTYKETRKVHRSYR